MYGSLSEEEVREIIGMAASGYKVIHYKAVEKVSETCWKAEFFYDAEIGGEKPKDHSIHVFLTDKNCFLSLVFIAKGFYTSEKYLNNWNSHGNFSRCYNMDGKTILHSELDMAYGVSYSTICHFVEDFVAKRIPDFLQHINLERLL